MLKSYRVGWGGGGGGGGVVADEILVSAQGPLVLGFGVLGLRVWGQGLTIQFWGHIDTQTDTLPFALLELLLRS